MLNPIQKRILRTLHENPNTKIGPFSVKQELQKKKLIIYIGDHKYQLTEEGKKLLQDDTNR